MKCYQHPEVAASTECAQCRRPTCATCESRVLGVSYCADCVILRMASPVATFTPPPTRLKSPGLAAALSLVPGLGQVYVGLVLRGIAQFAIFLVAIQLAETAGWILKPFLVIAVVVFYVWQAADAWGSAKDVNRLGRVPDPDEARALGRGPLPGVNGSSRTVGIVLVVLGFLLLLGNCDAGRAIARFLELSWPLALIGLGGWMLWRQRPGAPPPPPPPETGAG